MNASRAFLILGTGIALVGSLMLLGGGVPAVAADTGTKCSKCDINEDGVVDYKDLAILGAHYGKSAVAPYPRWDVDEDGGVGAKDLGMLAAEIRSRWSVRRNLNGALKAYRGISSSQNLLDLGNAIVAAKSVGIDYKLAMDPFVEAIGANYMRAMDVFREDPTLENFVDLANSWDNYRLVGGGAALLGEGGGLIERVFGSGLTRQEARNRLEALGISSPEFDEMFPSASERGKEYSYHEVLLPGAEERAGGPFDVQGTGGGVTVQFTWGGAEGFGVRLGVWGAVEGLGTGHIAVDPSTGDLYLGRGILGKPGEKSAGEILSPGDQSEEGGQPGEGEEPAPGDDSSQDGQSEGDDSAESSGSESDESEDGDSDDGDSGESDSAEEPVDETESAPVDGGDSGDTEYTPSDGGGSDEPTEEPIGEPPADCPQEGCLPGGAVSSEAEIPDVVDYPEGGGSPEPVRAVILAMGVVDPAPPNF